MHLSSASPREDPRLVWGNTGTLWGLCNKFQPLWWGKCGDFASVQLRGDWEQSIVRSVDGKMAEEKKKVCFKIHCFLSIKQTIRKKFARICRHKQLLNSPVYILLFVEVTVKVNRSSFVCDTIEAVSL